jgi:hypothetical protein
MSSSTTIQKPIGPVDLASERAELGPALEEALMRVVRSGNFVLGRRSSVSRRTSRSSSARRCRASAWRTARTR